MSRRLSFLAGVLLANSVPHLASAVAGRRHMIPGRRAAPPAANLAWAAANLAGGCLLLHRSARDGTDTWDSRLVAVEAGALALSAWMFGSEYAVPVNHEHDPGT